MIAVLTGSNGFIGSSLARRLLAEGAQVRCLVRHPLPPQQDGMERFVVDYSDPESLKQSRAFDDADVVFHVAGLTKALTLADFRRGNVMPTRHLIETVAACRPTLERFVLVSSQAALGPAAAPDRPVTETATPAPVEDYGRSKLEAENLFLDQDLPFPYVIVRPSAVYGPRDVEFLNLFKQLRLGAGIYPGIRDSYASMIHVDDLITGILMAARSDTARNETFFLTHEEAVSWKEIYRVAASALGRNFIELNLPFPLIALAGKVGDVFARLTGHVPILNSQKIDLSRQRYWVCSARKARELMAFDPQIVLRQGFAQTLAWYRNEGWI
jgi:nucleoside-diphosphate-sugar epimerase